MDRFEQGRGFALGVKIGRRRNAEAACQSWTQVGEDIPEQVAAHHHVKFFWMKYKHSR